MAVKKTDIVICAGEGVPSLSCTGGKVINDFYDTFNIWGKGKSPYCKKCLDKIFDSYYKRSGNSDKVALYYTLMQINTPFITEVYNKLKSNNDKVTVYKYMTEFQKNTQSKKWIDFSFTDMKLVDNESTDLNRDEEIEQLEKIWGVQDSKKDYKFLEETYARYTEDFDELSPQQVDLFRDLCRDRLLLRKMNDGVYIGDETIDKVQSRITKLMSVLKIDRFEEKKTLTISEQLMFNKIAQIELTKPADLYKEPTKYKDFNKVNKYYEDICLRPLKNCLAGTRDFDIDMENLENYDLKSNEIKSE